MLLLLNLALNALLVVAGLASVVCWIRIFKRRRGQSIAEIIDTLLPAREQDRPYQTNLDGLILFSTGLIMMISTQVLFISARQAMRDRGWIEVEPVAVVETSGESDEAAVAESAASGETENNQPSDDPNGSQTDPSPEDVQTTDTPSANESTLEPVAAMRMKHASADSYLYVIFASIAAGLVSIVIVVGWLGIFFRKPFQMGGLILSPSDVELGFVSALLILPPVLLISAIAAQIIQYEHPVLNSLLEFPVPKVILATFFATAVLTPITEELMLRGLIQGGLQRLADPPSMTLSDESSWRPVAYWPLVMTSTLFALMHLGQGAAPIPLFFLSLGLGYLYRQTGSLTAPIVVHMVLNGLTLCGSLLQMQA